MKKSRSVFVAVVAAFTLFAANGLAAAEENSQNSSSTQSSNSSMGTQKGKMGETERAGHKPGQNAHSQKMNAPKRTGE